MELVSYNPHTLTFGYMRADLSWQLSGRIFMKFVSQVSLRGRLCRLLDALRHAVRP